MTPYINEAGKPCFKDATLDTPFDAGQFYVVPNMPGIADTQWALHTNLGSITVLLRMTGFGWFDIETGYRDPVGEFWLASGNCDVRAVNPATLGEAIAWIKMHANTCIPDRDQS